MPFWKKTGGEKEKVNYKAKFQHKQVLAETSPEPVYDLIDCGLKTVPSIINCSEPLEGRYVTLQTKQR